MNVVIGGEGADELFETTEAVGNFRLFRFSVLVYHYGLDVASDLVEISSFISILMSFNKNDVVISWHAHTVNKIDIKRHDDSNEFAVIIKEV
jgi:hypothetical protein